MNNFLTKIIRKRVIKREAAQQTRVKKYTSLKNAKRVGFIINVCDLSIAEAVTFLRKELSNCGITYKSIGVDLSKETKKDPAILSDPFLVMIYQNNVNWYGIPENRLIDDFVDEEFDIVIDLSCNSNLFTIDYIMTKSKAKLKVGFLPGSKEISDIIISNGDLLEKVSPLFMIKGGVEYLFSIYPCK